MRACPLHLIAAFLTASPLLANAADLTKIERVIAKEPKYQGEPEYCLLVFGPEAEFRVWLVLDGAVLYVDRNGDGDLTRPGNRVAAEYHKDHNLAFRPGALTAPDGKTKYDLSQLRKEKASCDMSLRLEHGYVRAGFDGPGALQFAKRPQEAPIVHFLGSLTLTWFDPQPGSVSEDCKREPLVRGRESKLAISLGTPGLGAGTFAKYPLEQLMASRLKRGTRCAAEIRFANGKTISTSFEPDS
jgi:hypothetical protein